MLRSSSPGVTPVRAQQRDLDGMRTARALADVLGTRWRIAGFLCASGIVAFFYSLLLPFDYTQRFELANWDYLDAHLVVWSIVLGLAMGLVLSIQVRAMRRVAAARRATGAAGGAAFVASLLPSFLCCTPIIPSLLAFVGVSGVGLYTTTGTVQHFFAVHETEFLSASLVLLALTCWWGLRQVARSGCFGEEGCAAEHSSPAATDRRSEGPRSAVEPVSPGSPSSAGRARTGDVALRRGADAHRGALR
ncbi:MAG TPA: hypothetical protein VKU92_13885 [Acidimicrobiales bacterium]|nr:hypothetical protein [Acidimicrobiales bacterium]